MSDVLIEVAPVFSPLLSPSRYKGAHGGRGSGKSWFFAGEAVEALLSGKSIVCIREVQNTIAESVKRLIEARIDELDLSDYFSITDKEINCPMSGGQAIFRGMQNHTAASIKSLEGFDVAWWEEAQTASQRSLELLIPTIRKDGSELWFGWNPDNENAPIEFLRKDPPEQAVVVQANWSDNPWFPEVLRADMERDKRRDPDKYAHVWEGEYRGLSEARVFRNWRISDMDDDVPDNVVWFYGADWGFAKDETAALRCCIMDDVLYIDHEVFELGVPTDALPKFLNGIPQAAKWPMRADNARPETIDYVRRHGFPKLRAATKGKGSIEDGITFLQGFDIVISPRCVNTSREFRSYAYKTDKQTGEILPAVEDANNHLIDALRYAVEGLHRKGKVLRSPEVGAQRNRLQKPRDSYSSGSDYQEDWKVA